MAYVYRHIRLDKNEPFYIGVGEDRVGFIGKYARSKDKNQRNRYWRSIVNKTPYEIEILVDNLTWEKALEKEIEFISLHGRKDIGKGPLCNLTNGGEGNLGHIVTQDQLRKIRKKVVQCDLDGNVIKIWDYARQVIQIGFNHANVSKCCNGKINSAYGFRWHYFGENLNPIVQKLPKKTQKIDRSKFKKKIVQKTIKGDCIKIWPSSSDVQKEIGFLASNVSRGCSKGVIKYGYKWEYFDEKKEYELIDSPFDKKMSSRKKVVQKLKNGSILKIWDGVKELNQLTKFSISCIFKCCKGKRKAAYGYNWEYFDYNKQYEIQNLNIDFTQKLHCFSKN